MTQALRYECYHSSFCEDDCAGRNITRTFLRIMATPSLHKAEAICLFICPLSFINWSGPLLATENDDFLRSRNKGNESARGKTNGCLINAMF